MSQINGLYESIGDENFEEYLRDLNGTEIEEYILTRLRVPRQTIRVRLEEGEQCTFNTKSSDGNERVLTFTFNYSFVDKIVPGVKLTTTPTLDGNSINLKSVTQDGRCGNRRYEFTDAGLTIVRLSSKTIGISKLSWNPQM